MATAATQTMSLAAFTLPGTPHSARMARFYVRAALNYHNLGDYAGDVETVTSELVSNAVTHASAQAVSLELMRLEEDSGVIVVVVSDSSPLPPVKCCPDEDAEHGRGLNVIEACSTPAGAGPRKTPVKPYSPSSPRRHEAMAAISDVPMLHDMDADYTPQYVKLARILRSKIESGEYEHGEPLPADRLAALHRVSARVVCHAMDMLAANRYVHRPGNFSPYVVTWRAPA